MENIITPTHFTTYLIDISYAYFEKSYFNILQHFQIILNISVLIIPNSSMATFYFYKIQKLIKDNNKRLCYY